MSSHPNLALVRRRDFWRLAGASQLTALPMGVTPLAYTLLTTAILHSYRLGGLLITVGVVAEVVGGPVAGRLLDRMGPRRGLRAMLLFGAGGYGLLAVCATHVAAPALIALAVVPALPAAAVTGGIRSALSDSLPDRLLPAAVALDATLLEGTLIVGPLLAAGLATLAPTAAIAGMALALLAAAVVLPRPGARASAVHPVTERTALWREPRVVFWLAVSGGVAVLFGSVEVGALALAHRLHGGPSVAALMLTLVSASSALAGLLFAVRAHRPHPDPVRRVVRLLGLLALGMIAVALGRTWWIIAPALVGMGLCTAPLMTIQSVAIQATLPRAQRSEGFTLQASAGSGGYVLGSLAVTLLPISTALLVGAAGPAAVVGLFLLTRRRTAAQAPHESLTVGEPAPRAV